MLRKRQQQAREISQARISLHSDCKEIALGAISMPFGNDNYLFFFFKFTRWQVQLGLMFHMYGGLKLP